MAPACTFALFLLIATIVSCNADPLLIRQSPQCLNFSCPATDTAFYPLALDLSGPVISNTTGHAKYLACFYPFLSNCQYYMTDGSLALNNDNGYCQQTAVQQGCPGSTCTYTCPPYDTANYGLGVGFGAFGPILFCPYPTTEQPYVAVLYCNYRPSNGTLQMGNDNSFCPQVAIPVSPTTMCPSHTGLMAPTTVIPAAAPATSAPTLASPSTDKASVTSTAPNSVTSNPFHKSPASGVVNLSSRYLGTAIVVVVMTLCLAVW